MNPTTPNSDKIDLEQLLRDGNIIRIRPQGYSMYPLFIPGRDEALIQQAAAQTVAEMMLSSTDGMQESLCFTDLPGNI